MADNPIPSKPGAAAPARPNPAMKQVARQMTHRDSLASISEFGHVMSPEAQATARASQKKTAASGFNPFKMLSNIFQNASKGQ